ncbi:MAG: hypothetical protein SGI99_10580 [Pseudomonadota bacterium]|nr:hypothetical protein [Pseudomonadota bacterium]
MPQSPLLADGIAQLRDLGADVFLQRDGLIERLGNSTVRGFPVLRQAHRKITIAKRDNGRENRSRTLLRQIKLGNFFWNSCASGLLAGGGSRRDFHAGEFIHDVFYYRVALIEQAILIGVPRLDSGQSAANAGRPVADYPRYRAVSHGHLRSI